MYLNNSSWSEAVSQYISRTCVTRTTLPRMATESTRLRSCSRLSSHQGRVLSRHLLFTCRSHPLRHAAHRTLYHVLRPCCETPFILCSLGDYIAVPESIQCLAIDLGQNIRPARPVSAVESHVLSGQCVPGNPFVSGHPAYGVLTYTATDALALAIANIVSRS